MQYYRFAYRYSDPKTGISEGLQDFQDKYEFVSRGNSSITTRKQKRNDYENSDNR